MKKIIFILITLLISACDKEVKTNLNLISINLITSNDSTFFAKTVILFENNEYVVKTNFDTYINSYPFDYLQGYEEFKNQATQDSNNQDVIYMTDYLRQSNDSTYILAHHLGKGSCLIYDKKSNVIVSSIEKEEYMEGEPMMSFGGRRFYIKGVLFLETVDMIS